MKAKPAPGSSVLRFLAAIWASIVLFLNTLFSSEPVSSQAEDFRVRRATGQPTPGTGLRNFFTSRRLGGGGSGGGGGGSAAPRDGGYPSPRRPGGNIHTLPKPCTTG